MDDIGRLIRFGAERITALCVIGWNTPGLRPWVSAVQAKVLGDPSVWFAAVHQPEDGGRGVRWVVLNQISHHDLAVYDLDVHIWMLVSGCPVKELLRHCCVGLALPRLKDSENSGCLCFHSLTVSSFTSKSPLVLCPSRLGDTAYTPGHLYFGSCLVRRPPGCFLVAMMEATFY
jgi:hypothetical protein